MTRPRTEISRRQFVVAGGLTAAVACLVPKGLFAQTGDLVGDALKGSATAKITVQTLRRNVSVLLGPGGNIAVLTGSDGKLLVDAEIVSARPNVSAALASINTNPARRGHSTRLPERHYCRHQQQCRASHAASPFERPGIRHKELDGLRGC
jgi:hypothetical protein